MNAAAPQKFLFVSTGAPENHHEKSFINRPNDRVWGFNERSYKIVKNALARSETNEHKPNLRVFAAPNKCGRFKWRFDITSISKEPSILQEQITLGNWRSCDSKKNDEEWVYICRPSNVQVLPDTPDWDKSETLRRAGFPKKENGKLPTLQAPVVSDVTPERLPAEVRDA